MIFTLDFFLRVVTIFIFFCWWIYWRITEKDAEEKKPQNVLDNAALARKNFIRFCSGLAHAFLILQLLGVPFLQIKHAAFWIQFLGFLLVLIAATLAISARRTLGSNWSHAAEYQVKHKQELVSKGVYGFIRHPIYISLIVGFIGGELVAQSYFVFTVIFMLLGGYYQARLEEQLLLSHFGDRYKSYMKRTRMFLPFLW